MLKILFWLLLAINGALFAWEKGWLGQEKEAALRTEPQRLSQQLHPEQLILLPQKAAATAAPAAAAFAAPAAPASETGAASAQPVPDRPANPASSAPVAAVPVESAPTPASAPTPTPAPVPSPAPVVAPPPAPAEKLLACVDIGNFDPTEAKLFRSRLTAAKLSARPAQRSVQEVASYMVFIAAEDGREGAERRAAELRRLGLSDFYIMPESSPMRDAVSLGLFKTEAAAKAYVGQLISKGVRSARITERSASTNKVSFRLRDLNAADQASFAALAAAFPNQSRRDCSG